jgi:hypothetical protein
MVGWSTPWLSGTITRYQDRQISPATPERPHTRQAVSLSTQVAAQTPNPNRGLFNGRHRR